MTLEELLKQGKSFGQGASNAAASTVTGPVDMLAWLLRKGGVPVGDTPIGGEAWMRQKGLMATPENKLAGLLGEGAGLAAPIVAAAKAPEIAGGLLQMGRNLATPQTLNKQTGAIVYHGSPHKFDKFDTERGDRLTINPSSPPIGADLRPRQPQVHRICDRFQHLTHPHSSSFFSASLLASPPQTGRQHHHPARRSDTDPVPLECCCSLQGLVSVGPFASTGRPLRQPHRPTTTGKINGHYPAFSTTTNRLTPPRASVCFSHTGYGIAYPTPTDPSTGPSWTTGHPTPSGTTSCARTTQDSERSPWIISSTFSSRTAAIT